MFLRVFFFRYIQKCLHKCKMIIKAFKLMYVGKHYQRHSVPVYPKLWGRPMRRRALHPVRGAHVRVCVRAYVRACVRAYVRACVLAFFSQLPVVSSYRNFGTLHLPLHRMTFQMYVYTSECSLIRNSNYYYIM
jgi:hypothetical protein